MVKFFYILAFLVFFSSVAKAEDASFEAYIDREKVSVGETFQIKLELLNAHATSSPNLAVLPIELNILNQQQQVNAAVINGMQSSNVAWIMDVVANKEGTFNIPAIEVKTDNGSLSTKPFNIYVKPAAQLSSNTSDNSIFIDTEVENKTPYIDEPILYKTRIYHLLDINQAELVKPKADNAIVEQLAEAKPSRQILNGINYKMIEVEYIITPIATGQIDIEPSVLRGKLARNVDNPVPTAMDDVFSTLGTAPSIQMKEYVPFTVASNKVQLNVKPAEPGVEPWLALYNMQIDDELPDVVSEKDSKRITANEGEPITRKIRITAFGKGGEALPELDNIFNSPEYKVYADKAENTKEVIPGTGDITARIKGTKTQTFTFIPQKTGLITLPELKINYWSLKDNKVAHASLPGKIITIIATDGKLPPAQIGAVPPVTKAPSEAPVSQEKQDIERKVDNVLKSPQAPNLVLLVLSFFICVIMFVSFKILSQAKKKREVFDDEIITEQKPASVSRNEKPVKSIGGRRIIDDAKVIPSPVTAKKTETKYSSRINSAADFAAIFSALQDFAVDKLGLLPNASTIIIASEISKKYSVNKADILRLCSELDAALYAGKTVDISELKNNLSSIISNIESKPQIDMRTKEQGLGPLNP